VVGYYHTVAATWDGVTLRGGCVGGAARAEVRGNVPDKDTLIKWQAEAPP
jgi:hypothetical protein